MKGNGEFTYSSIQPNSLSPQYYALLSSMHVHVFRIAPSPWPKFSW